MHEITSWEIMFRLFLSSILAGFIGLERESHGRPAGLRTHILVSLGSCLMMIISIYGFSTLNRDPLRMAAQVVSGIGFLGAGTILHEGLTIKGLTTAASLWLVSGIGLAMGCGLYFPGLVGVVFAVLTLIGLENIERKLFSGKTIGVSIVLDTHSNTDLMRLFTEKGLVIKHLELEMEAEQHKAVYEFVFECPAAKRETLMTEFSKIDGVKSLIWK